MAIAFCVLPMGLLDAQDFNAIERKLEEAIRAGDLSRGDAAIMLNALKRSKRTAGGDKRTAGGDKATDRDLEAKKRRYLAFAREIEAAVKAGKLSGEEAEKKLVSVRAEMFRNGGKKPATKGDRRGISVDEYRRGEAEIQELVKKGKVSREDAAKRLTEMRKLVVRDPGKEKEAAGDKGRDGGMEAKKRRYDSFAREIEAAVKTGKLSRDAAEKKLIEMRRQLFGKGDGKPVSRGSKRGTSVEDYRRAEQEVRELVGKGVISREDANKKLVELRKSMARDGGSRREASGDKTPGRDLDAKKRRYDSYAREIEAAVKAGKLSADAADKKLIEMRKQLFRK